MWKQVPVAAFWGVIAVSVVNAQSDYMNDIYHSPATLSGWYQFGDADGVPLSKRRRVPGEFEDQQYLLFACSGDHCHSKTIARMVRGIQGRIMPIVLVNDCFDRKQLLEDLDEFGVDPTAVKIVHIPTIPSGLEILGQPVFWRGRKLDWWIGLTPRIDKAMMMSRSVWREFRKPPPNTLH